MWGKFIISQVFAIPIAWACTEALKKMYGSAPWYITVGIWGFVSLYVLAKIG
jgi:hypothetical protein